MKNKKIVLIITFVWIVIVFVFALQSEGLSNSISRPIAHRLEKLFRLVGIEKSGLTPEGQMEYYNILLRKCAHLFMFIVVGMLGNLILRETKMPHRNIVATVFGILIAIIGELVQLFVEGRTAKCEDVLLNSIGVVIGVLLVLCCNKKKDKIK